MSQENFFSDFRPDLPSRTGDRSGSGGATLPLGGEYDVDELFVELGIPVTDTVSMDAGFRSADYSTGNDTTAMKLGAFWTVNDKVSVRGSFQTSQRHANLAELYEGIGQGLVDLDYDPCGIDPDTGAAPIATQEQCLLQVFQQTCMELTLNHLLTNTIFKLVVTQMLSLRNQSL